MSHRRAFIAKTTATLKFTPTVLNGRCQDLSKLNRLILSVVSGHALGLLRNMKSKQSKHKTSIVLIYMLQIGSRNYIMRDAEGFYTNIQAYEYLLHCS